MKKHIVDCPNCGEKVVWEQSSPFRPFCSERCKNYDVGQWAQESYRIPDEEKPQDIDNNKEV